MTFKYCRVCQKDSPHNAMLQCLDCQAKINAANAVNLEAMELIDRIRRLEKLIEQISSGTQIA